MDLITQGLLGGVVAQSVANREEKRLATVIGITSGLLADTDVFIKSSGDPLLALEFHRHFTHALVFIPFGAAMAMLLLLPIMHRYFSLHRLYVLCLAGYAFSGLLDACTSYGTHLFWPFTDERISLNIISIIDPVFTLILLIALLVELRIRVRTAAFAGLFFCLIYLGFGYSQRQQAQSVIERTIALRGHNPKQVIVKPTLGNLILWRSIYIESDSIHVDAIRLGIFTDDYVYEGESVPLFNAAQALAGVAADSTLGNDISRFKHFSAGYIALDPTQQNVIGDIRYSLVPNSIKPLWGIVFDPGQPDQHVDYRFFREVDSSTRQRFLDMLFGRQKAVPL